MKHFFICKIRRLTGRLDTPICFQLYELRLVELLLRYDNIGLQKEDLIQTETCKNKISLVLLDIV